MRPAFTLLSVLLFSFCYAQNVGIGITTPAAPLHIRNNGPELFRIQGNDPYLSFFNNSGVAKSFVQAHGDNLNLGTSTGNSTGYIQFLNNNNLSMVINQNSFVGIGTDVPAFKLTVQTSNDNYGIIHRSNNIIVGTWIGANLGAIGGWYGTYTDHPLMFFTNNGGPQITLLQNGNVGIGTTTPFGRLHVNGNLITVGNVGIGTSSPNAKLHVVNDGEALRLSGTNPYFTMYNGAALKGYLWAKGANDLELGTDDGNTAGALSLSIREIPVLTVQSDSRVRVGANEGIYFAGYGFPRFTVNASLAIKMPLDPFDEWGISAAVGALNFYKNGFPKAFINDDGEWNELSDASLKENVKVIRSVLSEITKLQVSTYRFKGNSSSDLSFGLIAQNVKDYFPEIVSENIDKDGKRLLAISYAKTGVLAIKAIQEQQEIIESQQMTIEKQQKKIESQQKKTYELEKRLAMLESKIK